MPDGPKINLMPQDRGALSPVNPKIRHDPAPFDQALAAASRNAGEKKPPLLRIKPGNIRQPEGPIQAPGGVMIGSRPGLEGQRPTREVEIAGTTDRDAIDTAALIATHLKVSDGPVSKVTITGGGQDDRIITHPSAASRIDGGAGNDVLILDNHGKAGDGHANLKDPSGNETYVISKGEAVITDRAGTDRLVIKADPKAATFRYWNNTLGITAPGGVDVQIRNYGGTGHIEQIVFEHNGQSIVMTRQEIRDRLK